MHTHVRLESLQLDDGWQVYTFYYISGSRTMPEMCFSVRVHLTSQKAEYLFRGHIDYPPTLPALLEALEFVAGNQRSLSVNV